MKLAHPVAMGGSFHHAKRELHLVWVRSIDLFKFDLIVLDVMMPGQNGYQLTQEIKGNNCPPIILLTAKGEVENRIKGLELGADDYIGKPFEPKELLLRINNIISKKIKFDPEKKYSVGEAIIDLNKMIIKLDNANKDIRRHEDEIRRLGQSTNKTKYNCGSGLIS